MNGWIRRLIEVLWWDPVSPAWLKDQARREKQAGVDQQAIAWPINKLRNESTWSQRTKRRA